MGVTMRGGSNQFERLFDEVNSIIYGNRVFGPDEILSFNFTFLRYNNELV